MFGLDLSLFLPHVPMSQAANLARPTRLHATQVPPDTAVTFDVRLLDIKAPGLSSASGQLE